jgi:hypothetical protein
VYKLLYFWEYLRGIFNLADVYKRAMQNESPLVPKKQVINNNNNMLLNLIELKFKTPLENMQHNIT